MNGLDDYKNAKIKVDLINHSRQKSIKVPAALIEMCLLASHRLTLRQFWTQQTLKVTFALQANKLMQKGRLGQKKVQEKMKMKK